MAANGLAALGERERSRQFVERALAIQPDDPMLLYNAGCIFAMLELLEPALDCLEKAVRGGLTQKAGTCTTAISTRCDPSRAFKSYCTR